MDNETTLPCYSGPMQQLIASLYTATSRIELQEFRHWALAQLQSVIDFDGAIWSNGHQQTLKFHNHTRFNVPEPLGELLLQTLSLNPMADVLLTNLGQPIDMQDLLSDEDFYQSQIYQQCFKPMGIERILASMHLDERTGLFTLLTLYRFSRNQPFSQSDRANQASALFHLLKSAEHALFMTLEQQPSQSVNTYKGICDSQGYFHQAQSTMLDLLEQHYPQTSFDCLPEELLQSFKAQIQSSKTTGHCAVADKLQLKVTDFNELFIVELWPNGPLDLLSHREKQVVEVINQGMTFKQAAQALNLSPSTVSNHLYRIYQKLNVGSKAQLRSLLNLDSNL
ncbi:helix-turn-helix transcriptional regulator [Thalassotalea litorea]|uniref:Helix-turn-helix transcriptional regulator n=1 Tax=Thalassotalea litorea TaxID=2020715 RepID=A0A5R9IHR6_9GAMM|nr:helix-turn-helix transcriptional regulator [Thalassotalea litorea]TLU59492.1 helix-turn-helix transcriptional regulator [Thalassotalea litorea]